MGAMPQAQASSSQGSVPLTPMPNELSRGSSATIEVVGEEKAPRYNK